jgi:omega-6 fatty acid desaturase (delta-12 desaturase)
VAHFLLIAGLGYWAGWDVALLAVVLPCAIGSAMGSYLFYAQHNYPSVKLRPRAEWDYVFAALYSSSYIRMSPLMHWFTGNIGYHHVHHLNARIPFYRLPEAMEALEELRTPGTTSLLPMDVYRCLQLKLWDNDQDCMVPFSGK